MQCLCIQLYLSRRSVLLRFIVAGDRGARGGGRGGAGSMIEVKAKVCFLDTIYITDQSGPGCFLSSRRR